MCEQSEKFNKEIKVIKKKKYQTETLQQRNSMNERKMQQRISIAEQSKQVSKKIGNWKQFNKEMKKNLKNPT